MSYKIPYKDKSKLGQKQVDWRKVKQIEKDKKQDVQLKKLDEKLEKQQGTLTKKMENQQKQAEIRRLKQVTSRLRTFRPLITKAQENIKASRQRQQRVITEKTVDKVGKVPVRMKVKDTTGNYLVIHGTVYKKLGSSQIIQDKPKKKKEKEESFI